MNIWIVTHKQISSYVTAGGDLSGSYSPTVIVGSTGSGVGATIPSGSYWTTGSSSGMTVGNKHEPHETITAYATESVAYKSVALKINECRYSLGSELAQTIDKLISDKENYPLIIALYNKYAGGSHFSIATVKLQGHSFE
jgi:hypothetical protein